MAEKEEKNKKDKKKSNSKGKGDRKKYAFLMIQFDMPDIFNEIMSSIDPNDLYTEDGEFSYGLECDPHVTLAPCLDNDCDLDMLKGLLDPVCDYCGTIHNTSIFENPLYDVLKCDVLGDCFFDTNSVIKEVFPLHTEFTDYHPHMTIGYFKKGCADKYLNDFGDIDINPKRFHFSFYDDLGDEQHLFWGDEENEPKIIMVDEAVLDNHGTDEMESSEVKMKSFKPKKKLNPKIWEDGKMKSQVRLKLMDIADEFWDSMDIDWVKPKDYIVRGSLANYNWSEYSDIDLHIVVDFKKVYEKTEFVRSHFDALKNQWNEKHDELKVYGYPVELYVEDTEDESESSGTYSLFKNGWINKPSRLKGDAVKDKGIIRKFTAELMTKIDKFEEMLANAKDQKRKEFIYKRAKKLFNQMKYLRKEGLKTDGEMSDGNIIWKICRRMGYLQKLCDIIDSSYDQFNSLEEGRTVKMLSEAADETFDINELDNLPSFNRRYKYCVEHLGKPIGRGSSRAVFQIDDERVLKLAINEKGIAQNGAESDWYKQTYDFIPKIYNTSENYNWIDCEFVLPAKKQDFKVCLGVSFDEFCDMLDVIESQYRRWNYNCYPKERYEQVYEFGEEKPLFGEIIQYMTDCQVMTADMLRIVNWGLAQRNGEPVVVLLDHGLTESIWEEYYKK